MTHGPPDRAAVLDVELGAPLQPLRGHDGYDMAWALVRAGGVPLGFATVPLHGGAASPEAVRAAIERDVGPRSASATGPAAHAQHPGPWPSLTIAVCTRDRPEDLDRCLASLALLDYEPLEVLVVDNAPPDDATQRVCAGYARVTYVREPRPGLNWARNRAVREATGEVLTFTDDDVRVDPDWARAIAYPFTQPAAPDVVAGLVVPAELDTAAQSLFERYGGLSGGFSPIVMQGAPDWGVRGFWHYVLVAQQGSGANMAFRRTVFDRVGLFDPALDVGTPSNGGGDTEMFFRVLAEGGRFRYEPCAIVRHRHRRDYAALERQIEGWGSGVFAFLTRSMEAYPHAAWVLALVGARGIGLQVARLATARGIPRRLMLAELRGALAGPARYLRGRRSAADVHRRYGPQRPLAS